MAYHVGAEPSRGEAYSADAVNLFGRYPNGTTLGIEFCHPEWDGKPTQGTAQAAAELCARMCVEHRLDPLTRIQCHSWVTGKETPRGKCHRWFMENPTELVGFREWVKSIIGEST
jgi:N-acetylmuramoyl-L-alanine amidase CwlA